MFDLGVNDSCFGPNVVAGEGPENVKEVVSAICNSRTANRDPGPGEFLLNRLSECYEASVAACPELVSETLRSSVFRCSAFPGKDLPGLKDLEGVRA
jgi:hypothetical protein